MNNPKENAISAKKLAILGEIVQSEFKNKKMP